MNCSNHSSLIPFTVYCTIHHHHHCHCHHIPLSFPLSCAPRTSGLTLRLLPRLSSALYLSALDFLPPHPLPWVPLGAKHLTSPPLFDGPGQVCLTLLVLPAILLSLYHFSNWCLESRCDCLNICIALCTSSSWCSICLIHKANNSSLERLSLNLSTKKVDSHKSKGKTGSVPWSRKYAEYPIDHLTVICYSASRSFP